MSDLYDAAKDLHDFLFMNVPDLIEVSTSSEMAGEGLKKRLQALKDALKVAPVYGECEECGQTVLTPLKRLPTESLGTQADSAGAVPVPSAPFSTLSDEYMVNVIGWTIPRLNSRIQATKERGFSISNNFGCEIVRLLTECERRFTERTGPHSKP